MAGETTMTIIGNLTDDPSSRFFDSGSFVTNFTVASTPRKLNRATGEWEDGDALFLRCNAWGQLGENITNSLRKGHRVMVQGRLQQRSYTTKDDEKRTVLELNVDEIGPSLRYATTEVTKSTKTTQARVNPDLVTSTHTAPAEDPWSSDTGRDLVGATAGGFSDEPPF
ncbi:single-stranded DNA-binding protein [Amycolatopsis sp. NPDC098790]|uniref:single-stranded DNA-binding protein n=1 Tax=Amycolatopsis sp. NPDC098790 TaxID=3363939 RepID=UPI0038283251